MRVCLDTNVLVAAFATRGLCTDVVRTVLAEHDVIIGDVILDELRRILATKFKMPAERIAEIEAVFVPFPRVPKPPTPGPKAIPDPADRWVFATAVAGNADVLVTGDRDLLGFAADASLEIPSPREFWERLRAADK